MTLPGHLLGKKSRRRSHRPRAEGTEEHRTYEATVITGNTSDQLDRKGMVRLMEKARPHPKDCQNRAVSGQRQWEFWARVWH